MTHLEEFTLRTKNSEALKAVKRQFGILQAKHVITLAAAPVPAQLQAKTSDTPTSVHASHIGPENAGHPGGNAGGNALSASTQALHLLPL